MVEVFSRGGGTPEVRTGKLYLLSLRAQPGVFTANKWPGRYKLILPKNLKLKAKKSPQNL